MVHCGGEQGVEKEQEEQEHAEEVEGWGLGLRNYEEKDEGEEGEEQAGS